MSNQTTTTTYSVLVDALIYINDVTKVYIGSLQAARTILGLTTATGRRPATSSRAASPRAWWWFWWWWCVMIIISWSLELPPLCKCRNLAGFQSACWSSSWTALDPSSEEKFKWFDVVWSHSAELEHSLRVAQVAVVNYLLRNTGELFVIFIDCVHQGKWVLQYAVETWIRAFRFFIFFASSITENTAPTLIAIALKYLLENVICLIYIFLLNVSTMSNIWSKYNSK